MVTVEKNTLFTTCTPKYLAMEPLRLSLLLLPPPIDEFSSMESDLLLRSAIALALVVLSANNLTFEEFVCDGSGGGEGGWWRVVVLCVWGRQWDTR